jgi:hypothetical protein
MNRALDFVIFTEGKILTSLLLNSNVFQSGNLHIGRFSLYVYVFFSSKNFRTIKSIVLKFLRKTKETWLHVVRARNKVFGRSSAFSYHIT